MMPVSIQIQRWLMQTERWRFLGFVSAVVGLLCYALSSSFTHLFGHWNFFKFFLYFIFSFIIIFITLFAKVWQFSTTTLFKTRMAVLVLLATTFYSFFYDKAVNQKPDAYILISCVAFAVMSLSLSKQTHFGCEGDLLNYFLGCLILLLMKINLWLFFVGAGFSYSFNILHSSLDATPYSGISEPQDVLDIRVDPQGVNTSSSVQADSQHVNTNGAIQVDSHVHTNGTPIMPIPIQFEACISALEKEEETIFNQIWLYVRDKGGFASIYKVAHDENLLIDLLPSETINSLEETVKLMVAAGFEKECCNMYISCRREFLQKCLPELNLSGFNSEKSIPSAVDKWMKASYTALRILFPCERRLCNHIFGSFSSTDLSFMEVCRELTVELMNFPNSLTIERCSLNYLKNCLKAFHILDDLIPEFKSLFYGDASLINEVIVSWKRLGEAIRVFFVELEHDIGLDKAPKSVPNGGIDPIIISVVKKVFFKQDPMFGDREETSSVSVHRARIMELIDRNLEANSKNYTDPALSYVFMMNNCKCIAEIVENRKMATILVDDWIKKHNTKFQENLEEYHRTWDKVLDILKLENNESAESMKEKLKLFNMQFKEISRVQSGCFLLDKHLREQIKKSIENPLLQAYGIFIGRCHDLLCSDAYKYIEYGILQIEDLLNDLFRVTGSKIKSLKLKIK